MVTIEQRIEQLNKQFGFKENPEDFNFELNPERIAYRNEALRKYNRELYSQYLADHYPNQLESEMNNFDQSLNSLTEISKEDAKQLFLEKNINLLKSDFSYRDSDAIFKMMTVADEDLGWHLEGNQNDILNVSSTPDQALEGKTSIWLIKS